MTPPTALCAGLAAGIHVLFFAGESLFFGKLRKRFGVRTDEAFDALRPVMVNQGFYNLFLAIGTAVGIGLAQNPDTAQAGRALVAFACLSMVAAGVVLAATVRPLWRGALVQAVPPALALVGMGLG